MNSSLSKVSIAALCLAAVSGCGGGDTGGTGGASSTTSSGGSSGFGGAGGGSATSTGTQSTSTSATGTGGGGTGGGAPKGEPYVYVGGYGNQIHVFHLEVTDGSLTPVGSPVDAGKNPSFLAVSPAHDTLFAVNEDGGGKGA